jgi:hypothetical protein
MRTILTILITVALVTAASSETRPSAGAGLRIAVTGTTAHGDAMRTDCRLSFVEQPSNRFDGACRITVGVDELALAAIDPERSPTVVLNRAVTLRGFAVYSGGRFAEFADSGAEGFPLYLELDPLGHRWTVRADRPGGGSEIVIDGALTGGTIVFAIR